MTERDVRDLLFSLGGVRLYIGSQEAGDPEAAWGDTFCYYDPDGTGEQTMPFATIVTHDTPGWDEVSDLDRPDAFRVNLAVGRDQVPAADEATDHRVADVVLPHPQYATQGWVCIVNPGPAIAETLAILAGIAHARNVQRHRR